MTIEECYQNMGGSYAEVCGRLPSQRLVEKFVRKFLEDRSYAELCQAMQTNNREDAFRAAHTLKGVSSNLSFTRLQKSSSALTELLRNSETIPAEASALLETVTEDYNATTAAIRALD